MHMLFCRNSWMKSCKIITGAINSGKSTLINSMIDIDESIYCGFVSDKDEDGYLLRSLKSGISRRYLSRSTRFNNKLGRWYFDPSCFDDVYKELSVMESGKVYIDEVGRLELQGGGFDKALKLLAARDIDLVLTARDEFLESIIERYRIDNALIINVNQYILLHSSMP